MGEGHEEDGDPNPGIWVVAAVIALGIVASAVIVYYGLVDQLPRVPADHQLERNGVRTATLAGVAAVGAAVTLFLTARGHVHTLREAQSVERRHRKQLRAEQQRSDRLHLTSLFDSAADKLGAEDDATRTAAVHILERLYDDASLLDSNGEPGGHSQIETLRRAVIETLCGYVRERSRLQSPTLTPDGTLPRDYRSPASIRAAIAVLGRLAAPPDDVAFDISGSYLAGVTLTGAFQAPLIVDDALIGSNCGFGGAYLGRVSFRGARFSEVAWFREAVFDADLWLGGATILGDLRIERMKVGADLWASDTDVRGSVDCSSTRIEGEAAFVAASIDGEVNFSGVEVRGATLFDRASIGGRAAFGGAHYCGRVTFDSTQIAGPTNFNGSAIDGEAFFANATFRGDALFKTRFGDNVNFAHATFEQKAYFDGAEFVDGLFRNFGSSTFAYETDRPANVVA